MSALPQTSLSQKAAAAADSSPWLSLEEAARRSNRSEGHLARLCRKQWEAAGLAEQRKAGPGKATWFIHQSAHPDFSPVRTSEQVGEQLDEISSATNSASFCSQRVRIVTGWIELLLATPHGETEAAMNRYLDHVAQAEGMVISPRTLDYWREALGCPEKGRPDRSALEDQRRRQAGAMQRDPYAELLRRAGDLVSRSERAEGAHLLQAGRRPGPSPPLVDSLLSPGLPAHREDRQGPPGDGPQG
jgi:hypothetical protein